MPDPPPAKRRPIVSSAPKRQSAGDTTHGGGAYAELHAKTNFSFLQGASHPDELVERAVELGLVALAITDRNSLAGVVRAHTAAAPLGLKLLIGAEVTPADAPGVVLLATDRAAYGWLSRLLTCGRRRAQKGECHLTLDDIATHHEGLLALVIDEPPWVPPAAAGAQQPSTSAWRTLQNSPKGSVSEQNDAALASYREIFGDRLYLLCELSCGPNDSRRQEQALQRARRARIPLVAGGNVHYHHPARQSLHDVLTATRHTTTVAEAGELLFANAERYLKSPRQMAALWSRYPQVLACTLEITGRCHFSLDELRYEYPEELCPEGMRPIEHLQQLTWHGVRRRYPQGLPEKTRRAIEHELRLIEELRYEAYFLTVWDLVRFARSRNILCQGRGSAANSAVCYCLGVTAVDPARLDLLFERFVSRERNEPPDIDVDFEHERREEVLQYLYEKYGRERAGLTATVITYRTRSAVRDVGKALGLSLDRLDALASSFDDGRRDATSQDRCREAGLDPASPLARNLLALVRELIGFPRHLSQHVGGMIITRGPLCELVPIENAAMPDRTVIQWDKDDLDELGILKVDCLSLGMLSAIHKCFDLIERHDGRRLSLATVPAEDEAVYDMAGRADTIGVFQIESRAQMSMLPRLKPRSFYDLVIEVAIVRPGPIQGNMVHPYLRRRAGQEEIQYPNEAIRQVLEKTMGVPIFQEQAMRLAMVAAGFTPGEADQLRRAMGAWRRPGLIDRFRKKLIDGMRASGLSEDFAQRVFEQIRGFGEYGFPESHAASFALLVYVSAWLKCYYPAAFTASLLNSQPMGFYAPAQLVRDAKAHGVKVRGVDINASDWDCTLEESAGATAGLPSSEIDADRSSPAMALRLGLRMVRGLSEADGRCVEQARSAGLFRSLEDVTRRTGLSRAVLVRLARSGAFGLLGLSRRGGLWQALAQSNEYLPLFDRDRVQEDTAPDVALPEMEPLAEVVADYHTIGLSLRRHPVAFLREQLDAMQITPACRLRDVPHGRQVSVAGLVLMRQRPSTASGVTFMTLEDETGMSNLIVRPAIWDRDHRAARSATIMLAEGRLERQEAVIHVLVARLEDLSARLDGMRARSRDFH